MHCLIFEIGQEHTPGKLSINFFSQNKISFNYIEPIYIVYRAVHLIAIKHLPKTLN